MTTTYEQAVMLKKLGFREIVHHSYRLSKGNVQFSENFPEDYNSITTDGNNDEYYFSAPYVDTAIRWVRAVKGVKCTVNMLIHSGECDSIYSCCYYDREYERTVSEGRYASYDEAESALLDKTLTYLCGLSPLDTLPPEDGSIGLNFHK